MAILTVALLYRVGMTVMGAIQKSGTDNPFKLVENLFKYRIDSLFITGRSQFCNHVQKLKMKHYGGSLDNQTWQMELKLVNGLNPEVLVVCLVWLPSLIVQGPARISNFSYCARLWNWLVTNCMYKNWPSADYQHRFVSIAVLEPIVHLLPNTTWPSLQELQFSKLSWHNQVHSPKQNLTKKYNSIEFVHHYQPVC